MKILGDEIMSKVCAKCGNELGLIQQKFKISDNQIICGSCMNEAGYNMHTSFADLRKITLDDLNHKMTFKERKSLLKQNKKDKKVDDKNTLEEFKSNNNLNIGDVYFNDEKEQFLIKKTLLIPQKIVNYSDIVSFSEIVDGKNVKKKHGITRAVAGEVIAGPIGALVGVGTGGKQYDAVTRLAILVTLKDNEDVTINLITTETKVGSFVYNTLHEGMQKIEAKLTQIIKNNDSKHNENTEKSITDQLHELKSLVDEGILTQDEFNAKKKQLLNI